MDSAAGTIKDKPLSWTVSSFSELTKYELYALLQLRVAVFVLEQNCAYNEIDGQDHHEDTVHYLGLTNGTLCCYARRLAPAVNSDAVRIGRVVVDQSHRGSGLATALLKKMIADIVSENARQPIALSAQTTALKLYQNLGFVAVSGEYIEDGIPHVDMLLSADSC